MTTLQQDLKNHRWQLAFTTALALVFAYIWARHRPLYPLVFADEWLYSKFSRLTPLSESALPSYLYLWIFSATNACGTGFLGCVRFLNLLFFIASAPFIYLTARQFCARPAAMMLALMCVLAPVKSYTAYFMPESLYYFGFAVLAWIALARGAMHWARHALAAGAVLGLLMLVKVHGLFLVPSLAAFLLYASWNKRQGPWLRDGLAAACLAVGAVFAVRFGLGYALAGESAFNLFGNFYAPLVSTSLSTADKLLKLMPDALISLKGHLMALVLVFALPLAALLDFCLGGTAKSPAGRRAAPLYVFAILMLGAAFAATVLFSASMAPIGPREILRLHLRYYSFTFPLLLMAAAADSGAPGPATRPLPARLIALALGAALLYSAVALAPAYDANMVDGPEIAAMDPAQPFGKLVIVLELGLLALWTVKRTLARKLFVFLCLPLAVINAELVTTAFLREAATSNLHDRAGIFTRAYIGEDERKDLAIATTHLGALMRTQFHIDDAGVALIELEPGAALKTFEVPGRKKWLLVVGDHALPSGLKPEVANADFTLTQIGGDHQPLGSVALSAPFGTGILANAEGLWEAEPWGRWSRDRQVRLHFTSPLPKHLNLYLKAQSFGPNAAQAYTLRVGRSETRFRIPLAPLEVYFRLETDGTERTVSIDIPEPVSPKALGISGDGRTLGLGLISVEIGSRRAP